MSKVKSVESTGVDNYFIAPVDWILSSGDHIVERQWQA